MLAYGGLGHGHGAVRCRLTRHPPTEGFPLAHSESESRHILVVNDTEEILDLFRDIVEGLGHRMTAWSFSPDDLAKVTEIEPDLVILDLMLGPTELQGWALLQKLRMSPPTEEIPVIVCTAATNWVREQEGWLAANAVKVVLKPFKVQHLEHAIRQALELPAVMASAELTEDESAAGASPAPTNGRGSTSEPH
jgi:CheY-like chemotaxis protein